MKKIILFFSLVWISSIVFSQSGQLSNSGFEQWALDTIYEYPTSWNSSNMSNPLVPLLSKSVDAQHGNYSILLNNYPAQEEDIFSFVYLGTIDYDEDGPSGGIAYPSNFNKVKGYFKSDIQPGDTAVMIAIKYNGGVPNYNIGYFTQSESTWTAFEFDVFPDSQDSLFIGFISANPFSEETIVNENTWLMIDNIELSFNNTPSPALPNSSFENWAAVSIESPENWHSLNNLLTVYNEKAVDKATPGNSGDFCVSIKTVFIGNDTLMGFLSAGAINLYNENPFASIPYSTKPAEVSLFYKYTPFGFDNASIQFLFYKNGNELDSWVEIINTLTGTFQEVSHSFILSESPDSMKVIFTSGNNPASKLYIDDIVFSGGNVGIQKMMESIGFNEYPNPTKDKLHIKPNNIESGIVFCDIFDSYGKKIESFESFVTNDLPISIDVSRFSKGIYFYTIKYGNNLYSRKFIVE